MSISDQGNKTNIHRDKIVATTVNTGGGSRLDMAPY